MSKDEFVLETKIDTIIHWKNPPPDNQVKINRERFELAIQHFANCLNETLGDYLIKNAFQTKPIKISEN